MKSWHGGRVSLVERVAILRTMPHAPAKVKARKIVKRARELTLFVLRALAIVSHFEDAKTGEKISKRAAFKRPANSVVSVGLPYSEVLARVYTRFPAARTSTVMLRQMAWQLRNREPKNGIVPQDFVRFTLPQKRPHNSTRKVTA